MGLPGTLNFIGEFTIFVGLLVNSDFIFALLCGIPFLLSLLYTI